MKYTILPNTDIKVSKICLGTMTWGQQNTEPEGHEQMDYAFEKGVNFFDTAEAYPIPAKAETYGRTEKYIGTWFKRNLNRDKIIGSRLFCPHDCGAHRKSSERDVPGRSGGQKTATGPGR